MKEFALVGTPRSEYGKKAAKALRAEELVPCNIYGCGLNCTFTVAAADVRKLIYSPDTQIVDLTIGDTKTKAIVKELQFHPIDGKTLHIDFLAVDEKKPVVVEIPVQLNGLAEGVKAGGKLVQDMRKLKVQGIYTAFPDRINIDVTNLGLAKKFLIVGLGNIGSEYQETRHNIGFKIVDVFANSVGAQWEDKRYGFVARCRVKNAEMVLLKPSTYMNLSGNAVRYWLQQEKIPIENMLVLVDDLNLPFGTIRIRKQGSNGGHNGLGNIQSVLGTDAYARVRFGIGNAYTRGAQINFVLGEWTEEEKKQIDERLKVTTEIIPSFCLAGIDRTMNQFNNK